MKWKRCEVGGCEVGGCEEFVGWEGCVGRNES